MTLVIDAAPLVVALADKHEPRRDEIIELLRAGRGELSPLRSITYLGSASAREPAGAFLEDLAARRYETPAPDAARDYEAVLELDRRHADLDSGSRT